MEAYLKGNSKCWGLVSLLGVVVHSEHTVAVILFDDLSQAPAPTSVWSGVGTSSVHILARALTLHLSLSITHISHFQL